MGIAVLGPLTVDGSGHLSRRDRVVLETLVARAGQPVSADQIADALWGDQPPASAVKVLQGCMVRLRKALGHDAIETSPHGYRLVVPAESVDAQRFERLLVRARELLVLGEPDRAAYVAGQALELWNGQPFSDLPDWPPAVTEAGRLSELRLEAEELQVDASLRAGRHRQVLADAQALVRAAPLRERRWSLLAEAQYRSGQQADALRTLHQLRSVLAGQLGIAPGPDVVALEAAILQQDPSLVVPDGTPHVRSECPYQGLMPFDAPDADRFFGRDDDLVACRTILGRTPLLALVGPSGSGKSSLLRAGVASAMRREGRAVVVITPQAHPMLALEALAGAPPSTALLVDQFEELFTLGAGAEEQRDFLAALAGEARTRQVAIAVRADRLGDLVMHPELSRLAERGLYLVGGLTDDGIRAAVEGPARQAGLVIEHGLVELLLHEVHGEPGTLPLLSHALLETWKRREGSALTVAGYQATGGIRGAVAQSAERLYTQVPVDQRTLLRDLMLRLVRPGPAGEPVRTRVPRAAVVTDGLRERLVEMLVAARLVTADGTDLELTHEAVVTAWPRLRGWLEDDVEGQRTLHHLSDSAHAWDSLGRPDSELYRGVRLARALHWQDQADRHLTPLEVDFLDASRRVSQAEEAALRERARVQARLIRRLRLVLTGAVCLLVLALAAGGVAAVQTRRADHNAETARVQRAAAEREAVDALVRQASARALTEPDLSRSLLLAAASVRLKDSPDALTSLTAVVARHPELTRSTPLGTGQAQAVDLSADGGRVAVITATHQVVLVDVRTGSVTRTQVGPVRNESVTQRGLAFSPDGEVLAVGAAALSRAPVVLLDGHTLDPLPTQPGWAAGGRWQVADLAFSGDGRTLVAAMWRLGGDRETLGPAGASLAVWRLPVRRMPRMVRLQHMQQVTWLTGYLVIAVSPRGDRVYVLPDRRAYDVATGTSRTFTDVPVPHDTGALALSPDGSLLAFGSSTSTDGREADLTVLVGTRDGRVVRRIRGAHEVADLRFSADGRTLLTVDWPGGAPHPQLWDVGSGRLVGSATLTTGPPTSVALERDGRSLVSVGVDGILRSWDLSGQDTYLRRVPFTGFMAGSCAGALSAGARFVTFMPCAFEDRSLDASYVFLDVARHRTHLVREAGPGWNLGFGSWRPGTHEFIRASGGTIRSFDGRTGRLLASSHPLGNKVSDVDHAPDGSAVAALEANGDATLLDPDTFAPIGRTVHLDAPACCISAGPDGTALVAYGGLGPTSFWNHPSDGWAVLDLVSGSVLTTGRITMTTGANWAALSPDGTRAVITDFDGSVEVIDVARGRDVRPPVQAHTDGAYWSAFSPDGSSFVTTGVDGSVVLWDAVSGLPLARVTVPAVTTFVSAEFRPDGHTLLITPWAGHDTFVWDPSSSRAVDFACRMAGRDLSAEEWRENFGSLPKERTCS
jgi:DNA-binding SARP family transcriptional activator/WD40 repeat protein